MPLMAEVTRRLKGPKTLIVLALFCGAFGLNRIESASSRGVGTARPPEGSFSRNASAAAGERDSLHDGFPDSARIGVPEDRATFVHWLTFLAEAQYYAPSPEAPAEIHDCAGLIRFAFRNALRAHDAAWRQSVLAGRGGSVSQLENAADFGSLSEFTYPDWALGTGLFRTRPGSFVPGDLMNGAFAQFADVATLLHYNTFFISRDVRAARPPW